MAAARATPRPPSRRPRPATLRPLPAANLRSWGRFGRRCFRRTRACARARAPAAAVSADPASLTPLVARVRDVVVLSALPASPPRAAGAAEAPCALAPADPSRPRAAFHRLFATFSWFFFAQAPRKERGRYVARPPAASRRRRAPSPSPTALPCLRLSARHPLRLVPSASAAAVVFSPRRPHALARRPCATAPCDAHTRPVHAHRRRCYAADEASALLCVRPGQESHCSCLRCSRVRAPGVRQAQRLPLRASNRDPVRARPATNVH